MNTQTFNIRYVLLQRSEAGFSQLKARRQSCHYLITTEGRLLKVHEIAPEDGAVIIVIAGTGTDTSDKLTAEQFAGLKKVVSILARLCPDARFIHQGNEPAKTAKAA
jgi:hypothetical protein